MLLTTQMAYKLPAVAPLPYITNDSKSDFDEKFLRDQPMSFP